MSFTLPVPKAPPGIIWLLPLVPRLDPIFPEIDRILGTAARAALSGDTAARDALFAAFQPRFERSIRRCQRVWAGQSRQSMVEDAIEAVDIAQEAYLVFVDLLDTWPGGGSLSAFLCARFPWRLHDATRTWRRPTAANLALVRVNAHRAEDDSELTALLDEVSADLHPPARELLRWRVFERLTFADIARRTGVSTRTVSRRWGELVNELESTDVLANRSS